MSMSDIQNVFDAALIESGYGNIEIKKFSQNLLNKIADKVIFKNPELNTSLSIIKFSDDRYITALGHKAISFVGLGEIFKYELKMICLIQFFYGQKVSYKKLKWPTIITNIYSLKKLAFILQDEGILSFHDMNKMPKLKFQSIFKIYTQSITNKKVYHTYRFYSLKYYGFIDSQYFELLSNQFDKPSYLSNITKSHSIVPNNMLLRMFNEITKYKEIFVEKHKLWSKYNKEDIARIKSGQYQVVDGKYLSKRMHEIKGINFINALNKIKKIIFFHTLLFTGMRKDEAIEIKNDGIIDRDDDFFVVSELSKTVNGKKELEWISSKSCNEFLDFLVQINTEMKERITAILQTGDTRFSSIYINHLKSHLKNDRIFSFNYALNQCYFSGVSYFKTQELNKNLKLFKIKLDQDDINQLEFLNCNFINNSPNSINCLVQYKVGDYFHFKAHQFRHTFAYFMVSNNLCSINEIKHQFKHVNSNMSFIYARRGFYTELINQAKSIDETIKAKSLMGFSKSLSEVKAAGGGVKFIFNALDLKDFKHNISSDPFEFSGLNKINAYLEKNKDSINFLPHGFCMNGSDCSLKSIAQPLSCINCYGYITTDQNLPYWVGLHNDLENKVSKLKKLTPEQLLPYTNLLSNLKEKLSQLTALINSLSVDIPKSIEVIYERD